MENNKAILRLEDYCKFFDSIQNNKTYLYKYMLGLLNLMCQNKA